MDYQMMIMSVTQGNVTNIRKLNECIYEIVSYLQTYKVYI